MYGFDPCDDDNGFIDANLTESEENVVNRFLKAGKAETRTLADIIMDKLREKEEEKLRRIKADERVREAERRQRELDMLELTKDERKLEEKRRRSKQQNE